MCHICPLPEDLDFYWGKEDPNNPLCLMCRHKQRLQGTTVYKMEDGKAVPAVNRLLSMPRPKRQVMVVMVSKLYGMPARLVQDWFVPQPARDALKLRSYGSDCFITDGERIWAWGGFPYNRHNEMDWDTFLQMHPEWDLYEPTKAGIAKVEDETSQFEHVKT